MQPDYGSDGQIGYLNPMLINASDWVWLDNPLPIGVHGYRGETNEPYKYSG